MSAVPFLVYADTRKRNETMGNLAHDNEAAPVQARITGPTDLPIAAIRRDAGTQVRAGLDEDHVTALHEALQRGDLLPFVTVYSDHDAYYLADGFHRVEAHLRDGATEVPCRVLEGSLRDAMLHAVGANAEHGLRRTNADKRRAVELLLRDEEWKQKSDAWIADACRVSDKTVAAVRTNLGIPRSTTVQSKDGRDRPAAAPRAPKTEMRATSRALDVQTAPTATTPTPPYPQPEEGECVYAIVEEATDQAFDGAELTTADAWLKSARAAGDVTPAEAEQLKARLKEQRKLVAEDERAMAAITRATNTAAIAPAVPTDAQPQDEAAPVTVAQWTAITKAVAKLEKICKPAMAARAEARRLEGLPTAKRLMWNISSARRDAKRVPAPVQDAVADLLAAVAAAADGDPPAAPQELDEARLGVGGTGVAS